MQVSDLVSEHVSMHVNYSTFLLHRLIIEEFASAF